jgi:hypothetical protein
MSFVFGESENREAVNAVIPARFKPEIQGIFDSKPPDPG